MHTNRLKFPSLTRVYVVFGELQIGVKEFWIEVTDSCILEVVEGVNEGAVLCDDGHSGKVNGLDYLEGLEADHFAKI